MNKLSLGKSKYSLLNVKNYEIRSKIIIRFRNWHSTGSCVGYIIGTDKKEEWLEQANELADKNLKANVKSVVLQREKRSTGFKRRHRRYCRNCKERTR